MSGRLTVQDVWAMVPSLKCKGLCTDSCGPIGMSKAEHELLEAEMPNFPSTAEMTSDFLDAPNHYHCPLLVEGRCSAYAVRPLVCRLWGVEETMPCPHGCVPAGGHLPHSEGSSLMQISLEAGGGVA
jgi:hypothetical protein